MRLLKSFALLALASVAWGALKFDSIAQTTIRMDPPYQLTVAEQERERQAELNVQQNLPYRPTAAELEAIRQADFSPQPGEATLNAEDQKVLSERLLSQ